jgi:hypothetical protein
MGKQYNKSEKRRRRERYLKRKRQNRATPTAKPAG